jgi:hypothetical protein
MGYGMQFIHGYNRHQTTFSTLDNQIEANNAARLMDAFVDKLNLIKPGFDKIVHKSEERQNWHIDHHCHLWQARPTAAA